MSSQEIEMQGVKKLTERQRQVLLDLVERKCEGCKKPEEEVGTIEAHRIIRGNVGGVYAPHNILMNCSGCHNTKHSEEEGVRKHAN